MTNSLITALLVGAAVTYFIELLDLATYSFVSKKILKLILAPSLAVGGCYLLDVSWRHMPVVASAANLVALSITMWVNKPITIYRANNTSNTTPQFNGLL